MSAYWWCSFADGERPKGTQFLGVAIIKDPPMPNVAGCAMAAHALGCNPGGEVLAYEWIADGVGAVPPPSMVGRLLTKQEAEKLDDEMAAAHPDKRVAIDECADHGQRLCPNCAAFGGAA